MLHWRSLSPLWPDVILGALILGPLFAPFLAASHFLFLPQIAHIIYTMGHHVCPQPEMGLMLAPPWKMAVCMRCYGTLLGVLLTRWWIQRSTTGREWYWLPQYGLGGFLVAVLLMLFYPLEWALQHYGVWGYSNWIVFPFGAIAGLGLGLLIMPLLYPKQPLATFR
ncbi:DUF2085 domain-containing protein [Thermosynechococcus sichuanensis E542]|uniref:DUF2085 domain-containing protein n=1 Tax=Thermosynechococcus sichuanensis E542 TaxID=2016101 RepID=A0A3B7MDD1_9CYAN|nr:DUF2085 domain-containing protein [Thermosynechococcus vestitus]AXY67872.1 DUF2085 domain-containing protein [Thermosynechococcus vestitus E542]